MSERVSAALAGGFYIIGLIAGLLSVVSVIDLPDYLTQISAQASQVVSGAFFQFLMMIAYVGMALALYPVLKKYNEPLAVGYVGSRLVAAGLMVIGVLLILLLFRLSQSFILAGMPASSSFQVIGEVLREARDLVNHAGTISVLSVGSLLLSCILFQSQLVPKWLSVWGMGGAAIAIVASCLFLTQVISLNTSAYLDLPLAVQEIVFAGWLIFKGFNLNSLK